MQMEDGLAALAGWLEEKYGPAQAQHIIDELEKTQKRETSAECMALKMMADLIDMYRKDMLRQIRDFKTLRAQESYHAVANLHIRHRLKNMEDTIARGVESWSILRDDYFFQRACYMNECRRPKRLLSDESAAQTNAPKAKSRRKNKKRA